MEQDKEKEKLNKYFLVVMVGLKKLTVGQLVTMRDEINKEVNER